MPTSVETLTQQTRRFLELHWNPEHIEEAPPVWSQAWRLKGSAPNFDRQGVYAFVKDGLVTYIGSGVGKGKKGYEGHGLGSRLGGYVRVVAQGEYRATDARLAEADHVITIGFPAGFGHLAIALEYYLLARMPTPLNRNRPGS